MDELDDVALSLFGLDLETKLPISGSFSSTVLSFLATDGRHYIVKRPWASNKATREADALLALEHHPGIPSLLGTGEHDGTRYLLIEGLDGTPWSDVSLGTPALLHQLGRSMRRIHATAAESFDGDASWHDLLIRNADRYLAVVGDGDRALAATARTLLDSHLPGVPQTDTPWLVHFDLRPGNILVRDGQLVGVIDFESCRGGHGSMDFFKLWQQVAPVLPESLSLILAGYADGDQPFESWMEPARLNQLMTVYSAYHGLAGLAWCYTRDDFRGSFPDVNRDLIRAALTTLA